MNSDPAPPTRIIDSHTAGEPTRVVVSGGPDLGDGDMAQRRQRFRDEHDAWRKAIVNEPRGSDVLVGALLCPPVDAGNACGVIFFNNVGYIGMCGHGTIGLVATLAYLGRLKAGDHRIETPVGIITTTLHDDGSVTVANVPSYRHAADVEVDVPGHGVVHGDVAWGGNWFFLCSDHGQRLEASRVGELAAFASRLRDALQQQGVTGREGAEIDHVELIGPPADPRNNARNFVLCPGGAYDRSPCGTGTSAKLACLAADDKLAPDALWRQESVIGSVFTAHYRRPARALPDLPPNAVLPMIHGRAHVTLDASLVFDPADIFAWGLV
ncbi:MAG TPA: 4-hydroxyproline epimerase [Casimicrobiaceae bacterium]|nr:4-hydroxyproline epimerase [Casimicrobiaceae bacterium]